MKLSEKQFSLTLPVRVYTEFMKTNIIQKSLGLVILVGLLGCGCEPVRHYNRLQVAKFAGGKLARKPYGTPLVFRSPSEITQPYSIIGMLSCEGSIGEEAGILNAMLYRCADMGGDGVLLGVSRVAAEKTSAPDTDDKTTSVIVNSGWGALLGGSHRAYRCEVVKFKN
jgi:hypothetical protein